MKQAALLIDIGNSRIKWAIDQGQRPLRSRAQDHSHWPDFERWLKKQKLFQQVRVVSVASAAVNSRLKRCLRDADQPRAHFLKSSPLAAGVHNGYRDSWRLGADRWAASIGAWHLAGRRRAVLVCDVGTALTLDLVDAKGQHQGGLISPGPQLMVQSLLARTSGIAQRAKQRTRQSKSAPAFLADHTRKAIDLGSLLASAALVDRIAMESRVALGKAPLLFLTGGAADQLAPLLRSKVRRVPALVLEGLAILGE
jgi:type III pantothenate kinase